LVPAPGWAERSAVLVVVVAVAVAAAAAAAAVVEEVVVVGRGWEVEVEKLLAFPSL